LLAFASAALSPPGEAFDISRPNDFVCLYQRANNDFGPPAGCGEGPGPHSRQGWVTSVASTSSTTVHSGIFSFVEAPTVAYTTHDAEDAVERSAAYDRRVSLMLGRSLFGNDGGTIYLVHPTKNEQIKLIRQSSKLIDPST
jgi:hypothetical protein